MKKHPQRAYAYKPQAPKFTARDKEQLISKVSALVGAMPKMSQKVSRVGMRGNRIYLYELVEQFRSEYGDYIKPLIDGKYLEFPYARITLHDKSGNDSTADWQWHNNQWVTLFTGTYTECINNIEGDSNWF